MDQTNMNDQLKDIITEEKQHIVLDCDEVLCLISPKWVYKLHQNFDYFNKYLFLKEDFDLSKDYDSIMMRPFFNLDSWLFRHDERKNFTDEEVKEFKNKFFELYDTPDYYDDLIPTPFGKAMSFAITQSFVKKISIVTRTTSKNKESKEKFLYNLFNSSRNKLDIYYIDPNETKADCIKELGNDIGFIAEDELTNINEIVSECNNIKDMNFYVPSYGYNTEIFQDLFDKCNKKNIKLKYYI